MDTQGLVLIDGIPVHPLFIHFAIVLLVVSSVLVTLSLLLPKFRNRFGVIVLLVSVATAISAFLAAFSGMNLAVVLGVTDEHRTPGVNLPIAATVSTVFFGLFLWVKKLNRKTKLAKTVNASFWVVALLAILATAALTFLAGHSGSDLTWSWRIESILG